MKFFSKILIIALVLSILQPMQLIFVSAENEKQIKILFTHDMHDHFYPEDILHNNTIVQMGGYARLQTAINIERQKDPNLLLVDAGDFSMGTLFQTIYSSDAPGLRLLGQMGYDVVTMGNHEYDFRGIGLANSLKAAKLSGDKVPLVVCSNTSFPTDKNGNMSETLINLKQSMDSYGVKDYTVIEKKGVSIGVFGLMGNEAASNAPMSDVVFTDVINNAKRVVSILKQKEKVNLILCLSHSGTSDNTKSSEDEILAKEVPEIDIIISAHSHTKLNESKIIGKTMIGSCGEYSEYLGIIDVSETSDKRWKQNAYSLKPIDKNLTDDQNIFKRIDSFKKVVQEKYLDKFSMKFDEVLANTPFNFVPTSEIGVKHAEDTLGNLISDSYIYSIKKAEGGNYEPIAAAIVPSGTIRGSFVKGDITVSEAFTASSLGIGADGISGYPLISVYLTGKELKTACEVDASISPIMSSAQLYMSGISFTFNPHRLIFNKVIEAHLQNPDGSMEELQNDKLYRVVAGLYSAQMLSIVGEKSFGILSIVPKTREGLPITDFEAQIIIDNSCGHKNEIKEWAAIADYLKSFSKIGGISQVPIYYNQMQSRKIVTASLNPLALVSNPNGFALILYMIVIISITLIVLAIVMLTTHKKRKQMQLNKTNRRNSNNAL